MLTEINSARSSISSTTQHVKKNFKPYTVALIALVGAGLIIACYNANLVETAVRHRNAVDLTFTEHVNSTVLIRLKNMISSGTKPPQRMIFSFED